MLLSRSLLIVLIGVALAACRSVQVMVDFDPEEDFSVYRTYAWLPGSAEQSGNLAVELPLIDTRLRQAVDRTLAEKGFEKRESGQPDLYVAYHLSVESKLDVYTVDRYYGRHGYAMGVPETRVKQYDEGTLVIDVADARKKELVWRGVGIKRVRSHPKPEQTTAAVNQAVAEILASFPPLGK
jgi:hypothetical protein